MSDPPPPRDAELLSKTLGGAWRFPLHAGLRGVVLTIPARRLPPFFPAPNFGLCPVSNRNVPNRIRTMQRTVGPAHCVALRKQPPVRGALKRSRGLPSGSVCLCLQTIGHFWASCTCPRDDPCRGAHLPSGHCRNRFPRGTYVVLWPSAPCKSRGSTYVVLWPSAPCKSGGSTYVVLWPSAPCKSGGSTYVVLWPSAPCKSGGSTYVVLWPSAPCKSSGGAEEDNTGAGLPSRPGLECGHRIWGSGMGCMAMGRGPPRVLSMTPIHRWAHQGVICAGPGVRFQTFCMCRGLPWVVDGG